MNPKILHLTYDYSKENLGKSTIVIASLINAISENQEQRVICLERNIYPIYLFPKIYLQDNFLYKINHFGLPLGILLYRISKMLANYIIKKIDFRDIEIIHAHKLTFEGFIGFNIAKKLNKKLILSVRQTDFYVLKYRKDLVLKIKNQLIYTSIIFIIAPYMEIELKKIFGEKFFNDIIKKKIVYLPNIVNLNKFHPYPYKPSNIYVTICWLNKKVVKRKNLYKLLKAIKYIKSAKLDIIGYGSYENKVKSWIKKLNLENRVLIRGFVRNEELPKLLSQYKAFLMPSFSETFGVAYAEALACGVPILYSKDTGFDGIFNEVGIAVNPNSLNEIIDGIIKIDEDNYIFRNNIIKLHETKALNIFSEQNVKLKYWSAVQSLYNNTSK